MRFLLWISQHFVLGRIYPLAGLAVDYDAAHLWITMLRICGLRCCASVDYDAAHLWITGFALWISGDVGAGFISTPLRQD